MWCCPDDHGDSQVSGSQTEDEDFGGGGAWAAMKAEMGLDERNPSCFLHSYSVVMVLRKVTCAPDVHSRGIMPGASPFRFHIGQDIFSNYFPVMAQTMSALGVIWYYQTKWWRCTGGDL